MSDQNPPTWAAASAASPRTNPPVPPAPGYGPPGQSPSGHIPASPPPPGYATPTAQPPYALPAQPGAYQTPVAPTAQPYQGSPAPQPYRLVPPGAGYPPGNPAQPYAAPTRPTSGLALASMICGIVGILAAPLAFTILIPLLIPIAAVVLGHLSLSQLKKRRDLGGKGMAIAGLIMGYVPIGMGLAVAAMMIVSLVLFGLFALPFAVG